MLYSRSRLPRVAEVSDPAFVTTTPTSAFLGSWCWEHPIVMPPGTRLQYLEARGYADACSGIQLDWHELVPLDGAWSGRVVSILDAGTLYDAHGEFTHAGFRPCLGLPDSVAPERAGLTGFDSATTAARPDRTTSD